MGYTTDFEGSIKSDKPFSVVMLDFLKRFAESRRMERNFSHMGEIGEAFGIEGEFFVDGSGWDGGDDSTVVDHNTPPITQAGLWCKWTPTQDGQGLEWDGNEKFYEYTRWMVYLINKIIAPNGYTMNGSITWVGEDSNDTGILEVKDNQVFENGTLIDPNEVYLARYAYAAKDNQDMYASMNTKVVWIEPAKLLEAPKDILDVAEGKLLDR
jgi:hypothetical protein